MIRGAGGAIAGAAAAQFRRPRRAVTPHSGGWPLIIYFGPACRSWGRADAM